MDSGLAPSARPGMTKNSDFAERRPMIVVGPDRHRARRKPHCPKRRYHRDVHDDPHGLNPPGPTVVGSAPGPLSGKTSQPEFRLPPLPPPTLSTTPPPTTPP